MNEALTALRKAHPTMNQADAAKLCGVCIRTYRRWEKGIRKAPRWAYKLLESYAIGQLPNAGKKWQGWRFYDGRLWSPEDRDFTAGEIRALDLLNQALRALIQ